MLVLIACNTTQTNKSKQAAEEIAQTDRDMGLPAEASESGEPGYTLGNWKMVLKDTVLYGNYCTIWKKQENENLHLMQVTIHPNHKNKARNHCGSVLIGNNNLNKTAA